MRYKYLSLVTIVGLFAAYSPAVFAASSEMCPVGPPTAASYTWNFPKEASGLLAQMKSQAIQVRSLADTLQSLDREANENFWQSDATILDQARTHVNDMDQMLCRLETIRRVTNPWEKRAIADVAPSVVELSDSTQDAMNYLRGHEQTLMFPAYTNQAEVMYDKSNRIVNFVDRFQNYVSERAEARKLNHDSRRLGAALGIRS
jgi:hypothetical protein